MATILTAALGRDKARTLLGRARGDAPAPRARAAAPALPDTLGATERRDVLFQVFGNRDNPRLLPIAYLAGFTLEPITLDSTGWRRFDATYLRGGQSYVTYRGGARRGSARVTRGMWETPDSPLYTLQGCRQLMPLATVAIAGERSPSVAVEMLASTAPLGRSSPIGDVTTTPTAIAANRQIAGQPDVARDSRALSIMTGAHKTPTLVMWWIDSVATIGDSPTALTRHLFAIADQDAGGSYAPTFVHRAAGPLGGLEFRRYVDHLDLTGDGIDEIILEGWRFGGETYLSVLGYKDARWQEIFRSRSSWCLDTK
ncbi:MAG: hypothetical protein WKG32_06440 [Gemmatimonadaceae bacterium]